VEGTQIKRIKQYESNEAFFQVVSYNTVANDADFIAKIGADLLIIDEAQRIKNFRTKVSMQLKKVQTPYRFVLTGTPWKTNWRNCMLLHSSLINTNYRPCIVF